MAIQIWASLFAMCNNVRVILQISEKIGGRVENFIRIFNDKISHLETIFDLHVNVSLKKIQFYSKRYC